MAAEYQHLWDYTRPGEYSSTVLRYIDSAHIPDDPANRDRAVYTQYVADGGVTDPPAPPSRAGVIAQSMQALSLDQARQLNAQGRTQEAVDAILGYMEQHT